jgi:hypothetical protein
MKGLARLRVNPFLAQRIRILLVLISPSIPFANLKSRRSAIIRIAPMPEIPIPRECRIDASLCTFWPFQGEDYSLDKPPLLVEEYQHFLANSLPAISQPFS